MKKFILMLLIACSFTTITNAQLAKSRTTDAISAQRPTHVIKNLDALIEEYSGGVSNHYEVNKNPNTGIIESRQMIYHFKCGVNSPELLTVSQSFMQDEPKSYKIQHTMPGEESLFQLSVPTKNSQKVNALRIRTNFNQEMWLMCCKNPENPQLRDAYVIVWEKTTPNIVEGDIFIISSLRPDLYERDMETSGNTFRLDGRVGYDLNDSLYIFYVADNYDRMTELSMMTDQYSVLKEYMKTHSDVLPMPVSRNHQFGVTVDINKPMAGRIRTVMPDGSLCKLWTNIDMIPGETYRITTHNGYYEGDNDYQVRLYRNSHKSFFTGHENDDVELTGGYETIKTSEEKPIYVDENGNGIADCDETEVVGPVEAFDTESQDQASKVTEKTKANNKNIALYQMKEEMIKQKMNGVNGLYKKMGNLLTANEIRSSRQWSRVDSFFNTIMKQNSQIDKEFVNLIIEIHKNDPWIDLSKPISDGMLNFLKKQAKEHNKYIERYGRLSNAAAKTRNQVNKLMEKYLELLKKYSTK